MQEFMVVNADMDFISLVLVAAALAGVAKCVHGAAGPGPYVLAVLCDGYAPGPVSILPDSKILSKKYQAVHHEINQEQAFCRFFKSIHKHQLKTEF
jgi:hypothetical protein